MASSKTTRDTETWSHEKSKDGRSALCWLHLKLSQNFVLMMMIILYCQTESEMFLALTAVVTMTDIDLLICHQCLICVVMLCPA